MRKGGREGEVRISERVRGEGREVGVCEEEKEKWGGAACSKQILAWCAADRGR